MWLIVVGAVMASGPASAAPWWSHFEVGLSGEVTIVGLSGGPRAEIMYRPGGLGSAHRLRLAPGILSGPDVNYAPIALGYRAVLRSTKIVQPILGIGMEYQVRWVNDAPAAHQGGIYAEVGTQFRVGRGVAINVLSGFDFTFIGYGGIGVFFRSGVVWSPEQTWPARMPPVSAAVPAMGVVRSVVPPQRTDWNAL